MSKVNQFIFNENPEYVTQQAIAASQKNNNVPSQPSRRYIFAISTENKNIDVLFE